jgi:hypothetical protein
MLGKMLTCHETEMSSNPLVVEVLDKPAYTVMLCSSYMGKYWILEWLAK